MTVLEELRNLVFDNNVVLHGSPDLLDGLEIKDDGYGNVMISGTLIPEVALYYALFRRLPGRMPNGGSWALIEKDSKYFIHLRITQERLDYVLSGAPFKGYVYVLDKKDFEAFRLEECRLYQKSEITERILVTEKDLPFALQEGKLEYFVPLPYSFTDSLNIKSL